MFGFPPSSKYLIGTAQRVTILAFYHYNLAIKPRQLKKKKKSIRHLNGDHIRGSLSEPGCYRKYRNYVTISVRDREKISFHTTDVCADQGSV